MEREHKFERMQVSIEKLNQSDFLTNQDKASLVLVANGQRPAALIELQYQENTPSYTRADFEQDSKHLESILLDLGLSYTKKSSDDGESEYEIYYIGSNEPSMQALKVATEIVDTKEKDIAKGAALGIPKTAIDAFINNDIIPLTELPEGVAREFKLANFLPSKDHWQEEFEFVKTQNEALAKMAPQLLSK